MRGGAPGLEAFVGNPALASRLTDHYARRTPTHLPPQRDPTANTPPWLRNQVVHERNANNTNTSSAAPPHTAGTSNDPGVPLGDFIKSLNTNAGRRRELLKAREMDDKEIDRMQSQTRQRTNDHRAARRAVLLKTRELDTAPGPADDSADDEWLNAKPAASTRKPRKNDAAGVEESKNDGDDSPPPRRTVVPPAAPAPPVKPIPPVSAPTAPPVRGDVSPLSWLMDEAFRQNRTSIIQKLYPLIGSKRAHALPIVDLIKVAGISEDEFTHLTDLHRAGNVLNFPVSDNTGISSNGIPVVHVHGEQFGPRSNPARPLVIRTNAGTAKIKSFA